MLFLFLCFKGLIRQEIHEIREIGFVGYIKNLWNFIDFSRNLLFCLVYTLRGIAYLNADKNQEWTNMKKEYWDTFELQFICEGLFATASIFR